MDYLNQKTVVITGASRGIGEATARFMAKHGAKVVLAARSSATIQAIAASIRADGGQASAVACDVSDHLAVSTLMTFALDTYGSLDVLVNNAGLIDPIARIADSDPEAWGAVIDVNIKGVYHGLRYAIPIMRTQGSGTIINISSGAANSLLEGWSHYCASKAAVLRLTGIAHKEYGDEGLRVVGLSPGTVATDMQIAIKTSGINPVSQLDPSVHIPPEWVAQTVGYLCGPEGGDFNGIDFSLKTDEGRNRVGLPTL
jgi:NAD(P)-dependent dehydrogenase (short-subunit alcohol dehydrogenase family)